MEDVLEVIRRAGGAIRVEDLHLGHRGRRSLGRLIAQGEVHKRSPRVVSLPGSPWWVVMCRLAKGVLTCRWALRHYGLPVIGELGCAHVAITVHRGRLPRVKGIRTHREAALVLPAPQQAPVAPVDLLLLRVLRCEGQEQAVAALDAALHARLVTKARLRELAGGDGHGMPLARRRIARASGKARSVIETIARLQLQDAGHRVEPGVVIPGVGEVDLLVDRWFIVETDGYAFHSKPEDWTRDRVRGQGLLYQGRIFVRLTYDDVMAGRTVNVVELAMAGVRPHFGGLQPFI